MSDFRLVCSNRSNLHGSFAVYQSPPPGNSPGRLINLAWIARPCAPNCRVSFSWSTTLSFTWGAAGSLRRGVVFEESQSVDGDPMRENMIDLAQDQFGAPVFQNLRVGGPPGTMTINQLSNVFDFPVLVGVGMGGKPAYAVEASPNLSTCFMPHEASYWVIFGAYTAGEVFDTESISGALEVSFSRMAPTQSVVLSMDNILHLGSGN